jgi:hypothetical protein
MHGPCNPRATRQALKKPISYLLPRTAARRRVRKRTYRGNARH